jgi:hypothetical protein
MASQVRCNEDHNEGDIGGGGGDVNSRCDHDNDNVNGNVEDKSTATRVVIVVANGTGMAHLPPAIAYSCDGNLCRYLMPFSVHSIYQPQLKLDASQAGDRPNWQG